MNDVTQILQQIEQGDSAAAEQLLPLVYEELRRLARARMAHESPGHTLQPTALVHEAYLRLVETEEARHWDSRGHFFAAAAEAMRRILVERARSKQRTKRGGELHRVDIQDLDPADDSNAELLLAIHVALDQLAQEDDRLATLVKMRCFAGFSLPQAADALGLPHSTAYRQWAYAKSRLRCLLDDPAV